MSQVTSARRWQEDYGESLLESEDDCSPGGLKLAVPVLGIIRKTMSSGVTKTPGVASRHLQVMRLVQEEGGVATQGDIYDG